MMTGNRYDLADKTVWRVGYGAMQLAGDGVFGPPRDRTEAVAVLRAATDAGVNHIDTAQYYGPRVVNELIREALFPYPDDLALVSKVAARRDDSGAVLPYDEPEQLRVGIEENLATLGLDQLTAVNLRVMDNAAPNQRFVDQLEALVAARDEGLITGIGISNVTHRHLLTAVEVADIVCLQNASPEESRSFRFVRWAGRRSNTMRSARIRSSPVSRPATARRQHKLHSHGCWPSLTTCC
jgi:pyridoxine 4-dehydrogenase